MEGAVTVEYYVEIGVDVGHPVRDGDEAGALLSVLEQYEQASSWCLQLPRVIGGDAASRACRKGIRTVEVYGSATTSVGIANKRAAIEVLGS